MFQNISLSYPTWFILLCLLIGLIWSSILYFRDPKFAEKPSWVKGMLYSLRFLSASLIAFLLLNPLITSLKQEQKDPVIVFLEDQSQSIPMGMSNEVIQKYRKDLQVQKDNLRKKYEVIDLAFGEKTTEFVSDSFNQKASNIAEAINFVYDNYADQNIGGMILCSDGIYNEGANPLYLNANFNAPLHTIGLGDTSVRRDLVIKNVLANKIAYLGDQFALQVDFAAYNGAGSNSKLSVEKIINGVRTTIASENVSVKDNNYFSSKQFIVSADVTGIVRYSVSLSPINNEVSVVNNRKDFYIEVIDARQKILLIANSAHPDIGALQDIILKNKNYEVTPIILGESTPDVSAADLIIYHNLPSSTGDITNIEAAAKRKGISRLFIVGAQTDAIKFSAIQDVLKISGNANVNEIIEPSLALDFDKFTLSDQLKSRIAQYPPLLTLFGTYKSGELSATALNQRIKKVPTKNPLLSFTDLNGIRTGVLVGEGIWKWRMQDMIDNKNTDLINELINKTIQYLSVKDDKRKFRVNVSKNVYKENENVIFDAQLYNDAFEMVNVPDVSLTLRDGDGKSFEYIFSKSGNYYTLNAGLLPAGDYNYEGKTTFGGKNFDSKGRFSIENIQLEMNNLTADHNLLRNVSAKYAGNFLHYSKVGELSNLFLSKDNELKPTIYATTSTQPLLNNKWLFALIFFLLGIEWFVRRYLGNY